MKTLNNYHRLKENYKKYFYKGRRTDSDKLEPIALRGENATLHLYNGEKEYSVIDANSGCYGPISIGYSNPFLVEALFKQSRKLIHSVFLSDRVLDFCERMAQISPAGFQYSFLTICGSHANELALRLSWRAKNRRGVIALLGSFHGWNIGTLSVSSRSEYKTGFPTLANVTYIPNPYCYRCYFHLQFPECNFRCAYALEDAITHGGGQDAAAIILEPIQGQAGHIGPPSKEYFEIINKIAHRHDLFVIVDEVQTAPARTGEWFASQLFDIPADIITVGKGFGGGVPIGAVLVKEHVLKEAQTGFWGNTERQDILFSGTHSMDPFNAAAAIAVIDYVQKNNLVGRARRLGSLIKSELLALSKKSENIGEIRGWGLYVGVEFVKDRKTKRPFSDGVARLVRYALEQGVYFATGGEGNVLKIKPPLTIDENQVEKIIDVIKEGVSHLG